MVLFVYILDIEVFKGLDSDTCVFANTRFMARRGKLHTINSDKETNFVEAAREFKERINEWDQEALCERLARGKII